MKRFTKIALIGITALAFTACGGGSSGGESSSGGSSGGESSSGGSSGGNIPQEPQSISGGIASSPSKISLDINNLISSDSSTNYYKFTGREDDKLILNVALNRELSRSEKVNCSAIGGRFIRIYDEQLNPLNQPSNCHKELTYQLPTDGTYIIHFRYPDNEGVVRADSVYSGFLSTLPTLLIDSNNDIEKHTFYNYYKYTGRSGEKLIVEVSLNRELSRSEKVNCSAIGGSFIRIYDEQLTRYQEFSTCNQSLTISLPTNDTYILYFNYPNNDGTARVSSIKP